MVWRQRCVKTETVCEDRDGVKWEMRGCCRKNWKKCWTWELLKCLNSWSSNVEITAMCHHVWHMVTHLTSVSFWVVVGEAQKEWVISLDNPCWPRICVPLAATSWIWKYNRHGITFPNIFFLFLENNTLEEILGRKKCHSLPALLCTPR